MLLLALACQDTRSSVDTDLAGPSSDIGTPEIDTADSAPTGATGDTGTTPTLPGTLYPHAPYDCAAGVPPGPFTATSSADVTTTADFAFDPDGYLVASDPDENLLRWQPDGTRQLWVPQAAETRGIDVLPDGDVVLTDPETGGVVRIARTNGAATVIGRIGTNVAGIDVGADGTVYVGDLSTGNAWSIDAAGTWTDLGSPVPELVQTYGVALSPDERTLYVTQYDGDRVFRYRRDATGTWSAGELFVTLPSSLLAGAVTDACGNLYVLAARACRLYRVSPDGAIELLARIEGQDAYCPNLAFGRGLGGWDAYTLYVSTYHEVAAIPVGVPGRPR